MLVMATRGIQQTLHSSLTVLQPLEELTGFTDLHTSVTHQVMELVTSLQQVALSIALEALRLHYSL